jgi:hypothetical protein
LVREEVEEDPRPYKLSWQSQFVIFIFVPYSNYDTFRFLGHATFYLILFYIFKMLFINLCGQMVHFPKN